MQYIEYATNALNTIGIWFSSVTMLLVVWTWYEVVFGTKRKLRKLHKDATESTGDLPAILVANFLRGKNDMRSDVDRFAASHSELSKIPEHRKFHISSDWNQVEPEHMIEVVEKIREVSMKISYSGTDCIHLFFGGPHVVATLLGKEFANSHKVLLYQQDIVSKKYKNYGPMTHYLG